MRILILSLFFIAASALLVKPAVSAPPQNFPSLSGDASSKECSDAFELAKHMFYSRSERLYAPLDVPERFKSKMVLGTSGYFQTGDELVFDDEVFTLEESSLFKYSPSKYYWSDQSLGSKRLVVEDIVNSWRGDNYSLYAIDADIEVENFIQKEHPPKSPDVLIYKKWLPPLVFLRKDSFKLWAVDVGQTYEILQDWDIYKFSISGDYERACSITFSPVKTEHKKLLPPTVQNLAKLLDATLGFGTGEGTLQPTARLRLHVEHVWANVALRPWAVSESETYNTTEEVTAGLEKWASTGPTYRQALNRIQFLYPQAERDLQSYYVQKFGLSRDESGRIATWILDVAMKSYYVFHTDRDSYISPQEIVNTNPWPF